MDPLSRFVVALVLLLVAALSLAVTAGQMNVALQRQGGWWSVLLASGLCLGSLWLAAWATGERNPFGRPVPGSRWPLRRIRAAQMLFAGAAAMCLFLGARFSESDERTSADWYGAGFLLVISLLSLYAAVALPRPAEVGRRLSVWLGAFGAGWLLLMSVRLIGAPAARMGSALVLAYLLVAFPWVAIAVAGLSTWSARSLWPGSSLPAPDCVAPTEPR